MNKDCCQEIIMTKTVKKVASNLDTAIGYIDGDAVLFEFNTPIWGKDTFYSKSGRIYQIINNKWEIVGNLEVFCVYRNKEGKDCSLGYIDGKPVQWEQSDPNFYVDCCEGTIQSDWIVQNNRWIRQN